MEHGRQTHECKPEFIQGLTLVMQLSNRDSITIEDIQHALYKMGQSDNKRRAPRIHHLYSKVTDCDSRVKLVDTRCLSVIYLGEVFSAILEFEELSHIADNTTLIGWSAGQYRDVYFAIWNEEKVVLWSITRCSEHLCNALTYRWYTKRFLRYGGLSNLVRMRAHEKKKDFAKKMAIHFPRVFKPDVIQDTRVVLEVKLVLSKN